MEGEIGAGVLDRNPSAQVSLCRNCGRSSSAGPSPCCGSLGGRANNAGPSTSFVFVKPTNSFQEHRYFIICYCYISILDPQAVFKTTSLSRKTRALCQQALLLACVCVPVHVHIRVYMLVHRWHCFQRAVKSSPPVDLGPGSELELAEIL